ncbi:hypothetical protein Slala04_58470 [Streptomyces lavendulae subsp. lavendulae]|nr:hypothetical protein Slala04_58470 [Streptomyces lavendulae subsp. lavendulae]
MHPAPGAHDEDTLELFLGDVPAARTAEGPPDPPHAEAPVFVDSSGRRQRRVRRWGRLLVIPAAAYVILLLSTLMGGPTFPSPFLPSAQAPQPPAPGEPAKAATAGPSPRRTAGGSPRATPAATPGSSTPVTGPAPTKATDGPVNPPQASPNGRGRFTKPPGQGGGKPTGRP